MGWLSGALAIACVGVVVLHLLRLAVLRRDVVGEASHAAMGLGMAAMFSPLGDPVPGPAWAVVFVLSGLWFGALALRSGSMAGDAGHHVVGSGAMLFMLFSGHSHAPGVGGSGHPGHLVHGAAPAGGLGFGSVAAIVLAGYFAWHVLRCTDRLHVAAGLAAAPVGDIAGGTAVEGASAVAVRARVLPLGAARTAVAADRGMAVAMTVMLLAMV